MVSAAGTPESPWRLGDIATAGSSVSGELHGCRGDFNTAPASGLSSSPLDAVFGSLGSFYGRPDDQRVEQFLRIRSIPTRRYMNKIFDFNFHFNFNFN